MQCRRRHIIQAAAKRVYLGKRGEKHVGVDWIFIGTRFLQLASCLLSRRRRAWIKHGRVISKVCFCACMCVHRRKGTSLLLSVRNECSCLCFSSQQNLLLYATSILYGSARAIIYCRPIMIYRSRTHGNESYHPTIVLDCRPQLLILMGSLSKDTFARRSLQFAIIPLTV